MHVLNLAMKSCFKDVEFFRQLLGEYVDLQFNHGDFSKGLKNVAGKGLLKVITETRFKSQYDCLKRLWAFSNLLVHQNT